MINLQNLLQNTGGGGSGEARREPLRQGEATGVIESNQAENQNIEPLKKAEKLKKDETAEQKPTEQAEPSASEPPTVSPEAATAETGGELRQFGAEGVEGDQDIPPTEVRPTGEAEADIGARVSGTIGEGRQMLADVESGARSMLGNEAGRAVSSVTRNLDGVLASGQERIQTARRLAETGTRLTSRLTGLRQEIPTDGRSVLSTARGTLGNTANRAFSNAAERFGNTTSWDTSALSGRFSSGLGTAMSDTSFAGGGMGTLSDAAIGGTEMTEAIGAEAGAGAGEEALGALL